MGTITYTPPTDGTTADASDVVTPLNTIFNEFNGNIDNANIKTGAGINGAKLADTSVTHTQLDNGTVVQMVYQAYSTYDTTTTIMPWDNTIPQNTEGKEFMSLSITPKSSTNILVIEVLALTSNANATQVHTGAIFQDSTAGALAAHSVFTDASTVVPKPLPIQHVMVAGTTSATTFKVRIGPHQLTTLTFNGNNSGNILGSIPKSYIKITEYKAS